METLKQIKEEFLVCPICLRNYQNPKLLPCLHTFCSSCLADYVFNLTKDGFPEGSVSGNRQRVKFKCPVCRTDTDLELSEDNGEIVSVFMDNHLISNLMEKIDMHSTEKNCESCSSRIVPGQRAEKAEVWCQNCKISFCDSCIQAHNIIKACRDHVVINLRDMKVNPLQSIQNSKREIPCPEHKDKIIEFYCLDCRVAICSSCVAVQHRRCEMVETCADSAKKLKPETESVLKDLEHQEKSLTEWEQDHRKEVEELKENREELVKEIKSVRRNIDQHLAVLEQSALKELDTKHSTAIEEARDRLREIEGLKKNLENTNKFLKNLVQYGSDSEFLSVFDKVRQQVIEMNTGINSRKVAKLFFKHKFSLDTSLIRLLDLRCLGKIIDIVDLNKDSFPVNGENGHGPPSPLRKTSIRRTGTFKVDRDDEPPVNTHNIRAQVHPVNSSTARSHAHPVNSPTSKTPVHSPNSKTDPKSASHGSLSTPSPSTSSDSMSSQEMIASTPRSVSLRQQQASSARLAAGSTSSLPRTRRVQSTVEFRKTQASQAAHAPQQPTSKTPPIHRRSTTLGKPPVDKPIRPERRAKTPDARTRTPNSLSPATPRRGSADKVLSPPTQRRAPEQPHSPRVAITQEKTNAQLLCSFNGRTETDNKKCWPLDVAVLDDGTPVITDFHNKKIKAFDATGTVMCDVLLPSWPHGITHVKKSDVCVTLPEISTLVFVTVNENSMSMQKRIKTVKQYRGICCHASEDPEKPSIIVSCCASNNQSVDILSLEGEILHSFRHDSRKPGRTLFTWPYYVTTSNNGEIIVSDCETKTGLLYLDSKGEVKYDCLSIGVVIQDPRGICTDINGNVFLADKSAHAIHSLTPDGKYRKCVVTSKNELHQPIAVCVSPFGHVIVTQDNGDVKVYAID